MRRTILRTLFTVMGCGWLAGLHAVAAGSDLFSSTNLMAWCIVPFDAKHRGPEERAAMLERLGFHHFAYDYRAEHIPSFDAEIAACRKHGVQLDAWWFPTVLNDEARLILATLQHHQLHAQLWVMGSGGPTQTPAEQRARVSDEAKRIGSIARAAGAIGCTVALYNHGSWFGEPENQIQIIERLRVDGVTNVGIVYNLHHGHEHLARLPSLLQQMKPYLVALNLNGMTRDGERQGKKILPLGQGDLDLSLLKLIRDSGWKGPIGILNHTDEDAEARLQDNLDGLRWLLPQLDGRPAGPKPTPRSWHEPHPPAEPKKTAQLGPSPPAATDPWAKEDAAARAGLPEYREIAAANPDELTPASGWPRAKEMTQWHRSFGDATSSRYSALANIHRGNVQRLEVAWTYHSKDGAGNIQCNPIIVDDVLFAPTAGHHVVALDAATGIERWRYKPEMRRGSMRLEDPPARRGLLFWPGDGEAPARILFTCGDWLYALDPKTGHPVDGFGQGGRTGLVTGGTVAGAIFQRVLVVPGFNRDVFGYDVRDGNLLWTFHTLPQAGEFGFDTWDRVEDGANCWGGMALDEQRGIAYVATGSPKPNFIGPGHHGDNLFANCVLALDARTGQRLWHFQEIHHDIWDWDIPAPPNLVTVLHAGQRVDAVAQVTKLGNTLLLDRVSGKPLFPIRERRAPVSKLAGEQTAPYQPDVQLPEPFARQKFERDDVTTRTEEAHDYIAKRVAGANCGWFEPFEEGKATVLYNIHGGAEWTGAAFDPTSGCLYISANEIPWILTVFRDDTEPRRDPKNPTPGEKLYQLACASCHGPDRVGIGTAPPLRGLRHRLKDADVLALLGTGRNLMPPAPPMTDAEKKALLDFLFLRDTTTPVSDAQPPRPAYTHNGYPKLLDQENYPGNKPPWGTLNCLDLNTGKLRWKVPLGEYPELKAQGMPKTGTENFGGAIVTAGGLVFCSGTRDDKIRAFDSETGAELWARPLPLHGTAPPATYAVNGRQFVVLAATGGGKLGGPTGDSWVAFALPDGGGK